MTCYFRGLDNVFVKAGIQVSPKNRKEIDKVIRSIVNADAAAHCPEVWKAIKKRLAEDEDGFVSALRASWNRQQ